MIDVYKERFEHPYLLALVPLAGVLFVIAVAADAIGSNRVAGFMTLYAMGMLIMCTIGYIGLISLAYSTEFLRQWRIRRSDLE